MLKAQPNGSSSPLLREIHFLKFKEKIVEALENYIETANQQKKEGWQIKAANYRRFLLQLPDKGSLLDLKNGLLLFCEELRSPFNFILSKVVGPYWTKEIGETFRAPGSTLQKTLFNIAAKMDPYSAIYILNEIAMAKRQPIQLSTSKDSQYVSFNIPLYDHEYLSAEGCRVLDLIASDENLLKSFIEEAEVYGDENLAKTLLQEFSNTKCKSIKPC